MNIQTIKNALEDLRNNNTLYDVGIKNNFSDAVVFALWNYGHLPAEELLQKLQRLNDDMTTSDIHGVMRT